eukprot:TRINITY_DN1103_c0_g1_i1.p2 TRINITY_DN1103_c0_g1~~TRINITY_DN1103_c0_g1_i1.p2  ORF type:complete len:235 (+),score=52.33 TRINITY_DN1103_c0_g1_i1:171-875(+)
MFLGVVSRVHRPARTLRVAPIVVVPQITVRSKSQKLWDPFHSIERDFPSGGLSLFGGSPFSGLSSMDTVKGIGFNIKENDTSFQIEASLPGLKKDEIKLNLHDDILTVSGEKSFEKEKHKKDYSRVEHTYGYFSRSVRVPKNSDTSKLSAHLENGVLHIEIPKSGKEPKAKEIHITEGKPSQQKPEQTESAKDESHKPKKTGNFSEKEYERTGQEKSTGQTPLSQENFELGASS